MKDRFQKNKVTIISEIHPQHHGSMDEIKRMILQSKIGGADYVKVQLYSSQNLFKNDERKYIEIDKTELKEISDYSRNIGIERSNGKYIAFLDADDTWSPDKLKSQILFMKQNNFEISHTSYYIIDEKIESKGFVRKRFL